MTSFSVLDNIVKFKKNLSLVLNSFENMENGAFAPCGANPPFSIIFSNKVYFKGVLTE